MTDGRKNLNHEWSELREHVDQALKLLAQMPIAVHTIDDDPELIQQLLVGLSGELLCLHLSVGESEPACDCADDELDPDDPQRMTTTDWVVPNLAKGAANAD